MRLHSWRQASEQPSLPLALRSSVLSFASFPPLGGPLRRHVRWSDLQTAATAAANGYCATRPAPGDRPGSRSLREMKGRESAEHRSDTQPRWSVTPNPGPHTRVRPCQRFCRRLYRCRRHTALKQTVPVHTLSRLGREGDMGASTSREMALVLRIHCQNVMPHRNVIRGLLRVTLPPPSRGLIPIDRGGPRPPKKHSHIVH